MPPGGPGDRRLQHDRGRRQGHGLRQWRQGQLRHARYPAEDAGPRAGAFRPGRGQPGPEATRVSAGRAAPLPHRTRRTVPHREPGHLFHRQARDPRGQDAVQPVQPPAPRHPVPGGGRARRHQDRPGPPPRRHPADVLPEPVFWRQAQGHAAQAGERRRAPHRDPPDGAGGRERPGALGGAPRIPDHPLHPVRQPDQPAAQAGGADAAGVGQEAPRPHREHVLGAAECGAIAPDGWNAARFSGSHGQWRGVARRRQGVRSG